jgi:hypothetical protein
MAGRYREWPSREGKEEMGAKDKQQRRTGICHKSS